MKSIVRRRKPNYVKGHAHKVFANILNREFTVLKPNFIWATDFTYLPLVDGTMYYNCMIIDFYDHSAIVTLNGASITADLALRTLRKALKRHHPGKRLILRSDGPGFAVYLEFIYRKYNRRRPHSYNGGLTLYAGSMAV